MWPRSAEGERYVLTLASICDPEGGVSGVGEDLVSDERDGGDGGDVSGGGDTDA